ncbi:MAG TPA: 50S ribosomal protein L15 [Candidatus Gracilibacteria bacterium]|nr:50S ribosomal protein L15 [Candidatus Gracilibacteria bacterium]
MSKLLKLQANKGAKKRKKVVGRGNGSGHGTYSTRGGKGQTARTGSRKKPGFEGGQTPLARKMPKLKGFNNPTRISYQPINLEALNIFEDGTEVNATLLHKHGMINYPERPVKLLGDGELKKKLTIKVNKASESAKAKAEKAGAKITEIPVKKPETTSKE